MVTFSEAWSTLTDLQRRHKVAIAGRGEQGWVMLALWRLLSPSRLAPSAHLARLAGTAEI